MYTTKFLARVRAELETPRDQRPFGSGWLSGSIGLLAGVTGLLMVIVLRNPALTRMPELAAFHTSGLFKPFLYFVLFAGFALACLSLMLRKDKTLGSAAMAVTLLATMIGSLPSHRDYQLGGRVRRPRLLHHQRAVHRRAVHPDRADSRQAQGPGRAARGMARGPVLLSDLLADDPDPDLSHALRRRTSSTAPPTSAPCARWRKACPGWSSSSSSC